jgi:hypothetical protein
MHHNSISHCILRQHGGSPDGTSRRERASAGHPVRRMGSDVSWRLIAGGPAAPGGCQCAALAARSPRQQAAITTSEVRPQVLTSAQCPTCQPSRNGRRLTGRQPPTGPGARRQTTAPARETNTVTSVVPGAGLTVHSRPPGRSSPAVRSNRRPRVHGAQQETARNRSYPPSATGSRMFPSDGRYQAAPDREARQNRKGSKGGSPRDRGRRGAGLVRCGAAGARRCLRVTRHEHVAFTAGGEPAGCWPARRLPGRRMRRR